MTLFAELKRRNVFKVGAAYLAVAWLLIQISVSVEAPLRLPEWFDTTMIVLLAIGFPVALFLAWAYELTPEGIVLSSAAGTAMSTARSTRQRLNHVIIAALSLAVVFLILDNYVFDATDDTAAAPATASEQATGSAGSIAILPFEKLSDNERNVVFAEGVYLEIFNELERLDRLTFINRRDMKRYENTQKTYAEIAAETNARFVLELLVRSPADNTVRIDAELWGVNGAAAEQIWSQPYDQAYTPDNFFEIQASIARNISQRLVGELSPVEEARLTEVRTKNAEALAYYFSALPYVEDGTAENAENCLEPIVRAVELDPGFKEAWYRKGICHGIRGSFYIDIAAAERQLAIESFERALAIDDGYAEAQVYLSQLLAASGNWRAAGEAYQRALELGARSLLGRDVNFMFVAGMGHLSSALEAVNSEFDRDVQSVGEIAMSVRVELLEALGDRAGSDAAFEFGRNRFGRWDAGRFARLMVLMGRARAGEIGTEVVARYFSDAAYSSQTPWHAGLAEIFDDREALVTYLLADLERFRDNPFRQMDLAAHLAYNGEPELAFVALRSAFAYFGLNHTHVWMPLFREVRELEEFKDYMRAIGMVDVWREVGWPDLCQPVGRDDFRCD